MSTQTGRDEGTLRHPRDRLIALLLGLLAFAIYNANLRAIPAADTFAARYMPFSLLQHGTTLLDPILASVAQGRSVPVQIGENSSAFWILRGRDNNIVSHYPIVVAVLLAPLYYPAVLFLNARGWDPLEFDRLARIMEKTSASLIAALSVMLIYLLLRRRANVRTAAVLSGVYAFGTTTWVISGQALWSHGLAQLLITGALFLITGPRTLVRVVLAGLLCGLIAPNRPPDAILAVPLALYGLWWAGRLAPAFVFAGVLPVVAALAYNVLVVGHVAGAYALAYALRTTRILNDDVGDGVLGLLFSPTRGLFVFSPFLIFVPILIIHALRERATRALTLGICAAMVVYVVGYARVDWRQGVSWGPRWLTDMLPLMIWLLPPILAALSWPRRVIFGAACAVSVAIQVVGAFWYTGAIDSQVMTTSNLDHLGPMWEPRNAAFVAELRHPPAPFDLLRRVRGSIDLIEVIDVVDFGGEAGDTLTRQIDVAGWALVDKRTPTDIAILIDGRGVTGTGAFFERPDVVQTLGVRSPAGWRLRIATEGLLPGEHVVSVLVRTDPGSEPRLLRERRFTLQPDTPAARRERLMGRSTGLAITRLVQRQQAQGYWLTAFTDGLAFRRPQPELNTYLNAVMLDLTAPLTHSPDIVAMRNQARDYLTRQIEVDGLVRYHGRPDAPTIGTLGCAITPDSDDTALVWRVASGEDRARLASALEVIAQYRREDGLYRTWLAPRERYQCLDPGRDPNPADVAIQIHILMLLAQEDPPAAAALCEALRTRIDDPSIWVYYARAPLMVVLRQDDLARAGCTLALPPARLETEVPGQAVWIGLARLLRLAESGGAQAEASAAIADLLQRIAAREFALITQAPPLLYHNDVTGTVSRHYWSEDAGYALWLRLREAERRLRPTPVAP